jgi:predicted phosphodiesterase
MSKQRTRLKPHEAIALGFELKKDYKSEGNPKFYLSESQIKELQKIREFHQKEFKEVKRTYNKDGEVISKVEKLNQKELIEIPTNHEIVRVSTNVSSGQQWVITKPINEEEFFEEKTIEEIKQILFDAFNEIVKVQISIVKGKKVGNIIIADLHLGAYIDGLVNTKDYSITILIEYLEQIALITNDCGFEEVNVMFLGDMIESFTGLNHKNSWKGLQKGMIGAEVIKFSVNILHEKLLSKINNLNLVKLVAGNHDRLTSDKDEDTDGGACDLIAFGLELRGYNVEFHPTVISVEIDGINYILLHGHKGISRRATKDICWDFGKKGVYNVILEGHLHSIIQKLSVNMKGKFNIIKDDSVDHIRMNARSLFTGNGYSEDLGYTSNAGFSIITNNGKGLPNINNILL